MSLRCLSLLEPFRTVAIEISTPGLVHPILGHADPPLTLAVCLQWRYGYVGSFPPNFQSIFVVTWSSLSTQRQLFFPYRLGWGPEVSAVFPTLVLSQWTQFVWLPQSSFTLAATNATLIQSVIVAVSFFCQSCATNVFAWSRSRFVQISTSQVAWSCAYCRIFTVCDSLLVAAAPAAPYPVVATTFFTTTSYARGSIVADLYWSYLLVIVLGTHGPRCLHLSVVVLLALLSHMVLREISTTTSSSAPERHFASYYIRPVRGPVSILCCCLALVPVKRQTCWYVECVFWYSALSHRPLIVHCHHVPPHHVFCSVRVLVLVSVSILVLVSVPVLVSVSVSILVSVSVSVLVLVCSCR